MHLWSVHVCSFIPLKEQVSRACVKAPAIATLVYVNLSANVSRQSDL